MYTGQKSLKQAVEDQVPPELSLLAVVRYGPETEVGHTGKGRGQQNPRFVLAPGGGFGPVDQVTTYRVGHGVPQLPSKYDHGHMGGVNLCYLQKKNTHKESKHSAGDLIRGATYSEADLPPDRKWLGFFPEFPSSSRLHIFRNLIIMSLHYAEQSPL